MRWNYKYPTSKKSKFADVAINCMFKGAIQVYYKEMKPVNINCLYIFETPCYIANTFLV